MSPFRKLLLVTAGALALYSVQACSTDTDLNPQPLPPMDPERTGAPSDGDQKSSAPGNGGTTSGGAGGMDPAPGAADAGSHEGGDAADGGDG